jgi:hypothetical protein
VANAVRSVAVTVVVGFLVLLMVGVGLVIGTGQVEGRSTVGGRQVIVRSGAFSGIGISDASASRKSMKVEVGGRLVLVGADEIEVVGVRKVSLAPECQKVEIVQSRGDVQVFLDGVEAK